MANALFNKGTLFCFFLLFETPIVTFWSSCALKNVIWQLVSSKYGAWYSERVILQFMCVGSLAGVTYLHYTVLTSFNRSETTVHCCDPPLSVLAILVPPNVFHVVSALHFIVFKQKVFNASVQTTAGHVLYFQFSEKNTWGLTSGLINIPRGERKRQEGIGVGRRVTPPLTFKPDRGK